MKFRRASRPPGPPGCDNYYISKEVREWQAVERKWMQSEFDRIMHALLRKPRSGDKTMRPRTGDEAAAFFQYGRAHKVIDPNMHRMEFARLVADYAMEIGLPGAEDLDPTSGPMKAMAATILRSEAGQRAVAAHLLLPPSLFRLPR